MQRALSWCRPAAKTIEGNLCQSCPRTPWGWWSGKRIKTPRIRIGIHKSQNRVVRRRVRLSRARRREWRRPQPPTWVWTCARTWRIHWQTRAAARCRAYSSSTPRSSAYTPPRCKPTVPALHVVSVRLADRFFFSASLSLHVKDLCSRLRRSLHVMCLHCSHFIL